MESSAAATIEIDQPLMIDQFLEQARMDAICIIRIYKQKLNSLRDRGHVPKVFELRIDKEISIKTREIIEFYFLYQKDWLKIKYGKKKSGQLFIELSKESGKEIRFIQ